MGSTPVRQAREEPGASCASPATMSASATRIPERALRHRSAPVADKCGQRHRGERDEQAGHGQATAEGPCPPIEPRDHQPGQEICNPEHQRPEPEGERGVGYILLRRLNGVRTLDIEAEPLVARPRAPYSALVDG